MFSVRTIVIEERCSHSQMNSNERVAICLDKCFIDEGWSSRQTIIRSERQRRRQWNDWGLVIGVGYQCCLISEFSLIFTKSTAEKIPKLNGKRQGNGGGVAKKCPKQSSINRRDNDSSKKKNDVML